MVTVDLEQDSTNQTSQLNCCGACVLTILTTSSSSFGSTRMQNLLVRTCIGKFIVMWHNNYDEKTYWTPVVITKKERNKNKELEDEFKVGGPSHLIVFLHCQFTKDVFKAY